MPTCDAHHLTEVMVHLSSHYTQPPMHTLKHLLVALDLSPMDNQLMQYLSYFSQALLPDTITFVHVIPTNTISSEAFATAADQQAYYDAHILTVTQQLEQLVNKYWGHRSDVLKQIQVLTGHPLKTLLQHNTENAYDLIVVGKKNVSSGSGIVAQKLARHTTTSILFIPQHAPTVCNDILIPVDFSGHSMAALQLGIQLSPLLNDPTLHVAHVYDVPPAVSIQLSRTPQQFAHIIRNNVSEAMDQFVAKAKPGKANLQKHLMHNANSTTARQLITYAEVNQLSLVIIGAKGHTALSALLLGSITEKLLLSTLQIPILVARIPAMS